ncbi:hypothetical protein N7G274_000333 [Stereocaulon virgatum]|uniref:Uncharacterized protein n=1 Tax=Stereocaulon virgatum TaxID=373712 RepID=A0ABR4AU75_9LECA
MMDSIGSVAAMYERTSSATCPINHDFATFHVSRDYLGEQILACNGIQAYDDYCQASEAIRLAQRETNLKKFQAKLARKAAIRATAYRFLYIEAKIEMKLIGLLSNVIEKAAYRQLCL